MQPHIKSKGRLLIVDDDQTHLHLFKAIGTKKGYTVKTVPDGKHAIETIRDWHPSLVVLDIQMPMMSGYETLKEIRSLERALYLPVLLVTAHTSLADKKLGFEAGADDFIAKPYNPEELFLRINAHLRRYRQSSEVERHLPKENIRVPIMIGRSRSGLFKKGYAISKRLFDFTMSLLALPFVLPVMICIAVIVRLDSPGPVLLKQERTGKNGKLFKMLKFRTMVVNAQELKEKYAHLNELTWPDFKIANDPRVTRAGRFLRKSSLDELPQLINILLGDMSIVGPRPTSFKADTYQLWQTERLEVRPGLTGLWQVTGRSDVDFVERVELDIEYIERQSWALDIKIIWQTFAAVAQAKGAH